MLRAFQWDLARQVERLDVLLKLLPRYADWGYNELYLHLEDAVEYPSLPTVARADAYSHRQLHRLVNTAERHGIRTVPIVNLLGHTQYLIKAPALRDLNELRAPDGSPLERGQICPLHADTLAVAEKLLHDTAPFCTAGKVHVGLDESFHLGKCPRCRAEIADRGLAAHFAGHVNRLHTLTSSRGLQLGLWADMLNFIPSAIPLLPRDIAAYDWYYYPFTRHPRVELFNFAESDLATPLAKHGIDYWGCPMNGAFRYEPLPLFRDRLANLRSWWKRCHDTNAAGFLVTSWEAYRLALETTTVVDAAAASLWLNPKKSTDDETLLTAGFERVFGKGKKLSARHAARTALAADARAFTGYARWEINDRWDLRAATTRSPASRLRTSTGHWSLVTGHSPSSPSAPFTLHPSPFTLPRPLASSLAFLAYLESRDTFVARAADGIFALRRTLASSARPNSQLSTLNSQLGSSPLIRLRLDDLTRDARVFARQLATGRRAARAMWLRTRDAKVRGQNELILDADAARLATWRTFLRSLRRRPDLALDTTPVCGRWQLVFTVENIAPALQKIVVEQQQPDRTWRELRARHTIEFRSEAAQPRANISRLFSTPIDDPSRPLRLSLRGLGQVAIRDLALTNCVTTLRPAAWPRTTKKILGHPAPTRGFPDITRTLATLPLRFPR
ncbi:glycoside hydrolase family 20 [Nibricoccus aquaticus]|uniref:Glycoside hydrolase family 20 n=1 Tax=Nibricoccus aquaticus TaxID=2576891 RepID=A0A290QHB5_9BACT|nr:family 20 glycosylhydrolase [Nibricoccus aquaticus]ATC63751.1 glycoside hydrolase family 20 [Nibricoccus aquaticus]